LGEIALTALRQAGESFAEFFCRHCSASAPPGVTPEQFDMKSDRQDERMAFCCSAVGCAFAAPAAKRSSAARPCRRKKSDRILRPSQY
jgi:hypothetical protein